MDGWYVGNILFGGIIGFFVDPATGAMWKLDDTVYGTLVPLPSPKPADTPVQSPQPTQREVPLSVSERLKNLRELKESGLLTDGEYEEKRKALIDKL